MISVNCDNAYNQGITGTIFLSDEGLVRVVISFDVIYKDGPLSFNLILHLNNNRELVGGWFQLDRVVLQVGVIIDRKWRVVATFRELILSEEILDSFRIVNGIQGQLSQIVCFLDKNFVSVNNCYVLHQNWL